MRAQFIGRVLGTGLRVAGKMAGQTLTAALEPTPPQSAPASPPPQTQTIAGTADRNHRRHPTVAQAGGGVARGLGGFLRPFQRVGSILWLEVTGVFFLLPVVVFGPKLWQMRASWQHGPDHRMFLITAGVVVVFLYLGVTSFWRARRK